MILKLVYHKEIHVYDLKPNQSLEQLIIKIKQLFKKIPSQFILYYKNINQQEIILNNNQEFNQLINQMQKDVKIFKLFIKNISNNNLSETTSQQKIQSIPNNQQINQLTQNIKIIHDTDGLSEKFTNLHQLNDEIERFNLQEQKYENSNLQVTAKQFENLQDNEYLQINPKQEEKIQQRQQLSQRQLHVNLGEISDPEELKISSSISVQKNKQNLNSKPSEQNKEIFHLVIKQFTGKISKQQIQEKLNKEQKVIHNLSQKMFNQVEPKIGEKIQDDFKSHNVKCDICNAFPICGARYKCVLCVNYDLCQKCEEKFSHENPLLKICYTYQTPIKIQVQIPEFNDIPKKKIPIVYQKANLQGLSSQQRRQRTLNEASQISELLNIEMQQCMKFVGENLQYTKQALIQMLIDRNCNINQRNDPRNLQSGRQGFGAIVGNIKDYIFG